jgi:hypothetical protein
MRVQALLLSITVVTVLCGSEPVGARTDCKTNVTAVCIDLASHVDAYRSLIWATCDAESATVCKCYDAQQRESGVDWCQWAACACQSTADATLKNGLCGLATACSTVAGLKTKQRAAAAHSAPANVEAQAEQVRAGQIVDCSPEVCLASGQQCARAAGALEILKDQGTISDGAKCSQAAKHTAAFAKQLHVDGLTAAVGACACAAVF